MLGLVLLVLGSSNQAAEGGLLAASPLPELGQGWHCRPEVALIFLLHPPTPLSFPVPNCSVGDKQPMILKWRILSATNDLDRVSAVALPKLPISLTNTDLKVASDTQFYPGLGMLSPGAASTASGPVCDGRRGGDGF